MREGFISAVYSEHMGSDLSVVNAARQSFNKQKEHFEEEKDTGLIGYLATGLRTKEWEASIEDICNSSREELKDKLLAYKRKAVHFAPFAHPHVTLRIRLPIFLARQFVKHQIGGTWSEESRRYMSSEVEYYFEEVVHGRPADIKQGAQGVHPNSEGLLNSMRAITATADGVYQHLLSQGVAPEEAREILTLNAMTGVTWTGSLLFWSRVCTQRVDTHAQKAAQKLGRLIDPILRELYPVSWQALVGNLPAQE